jgi:hypothetical protein
MHAGENRGSGLTGACFLLSCVCARVSMPVRRSDCESDAEEEKTEEVDIIMGQNYQYMHGVPHRSALCTSWLRLLVKEHGGTKKLPRGTDEEKSRQQRERQAALDGLHVDVACTWDAYMPVDSFALVSPSV